VEQRRTGILAIRELYSIARLHTVPGSAGYTAPVHLPPLPLYIPVCVARGDILRRINRVSDRHVTRMMTRADGNSKRVYVGNMCLSVRRHVSISDGINVQLFLQLIFKAMTITTTIRKCPACFYTSKNVCTTVLKHFKAWR